MYNYLIIIPKHLITEENTEGKLQAEFSYNFRVGKPNPEGVIIVTMDRLLHHLNNSTVLPDLIKPVLYTGKR